jgi:hypothetical protein
MVMIRITVCFGAKNSRIHQVNTSVKMEIHSLCKFVDIMVPLL